MKKLTYTFTSLGIHTRFTALLLFICLMTFCQLLWSNSIHFCSPVSCQDNFHFKLYFFSPSCMKDICFHKHGMQNHPSRRNKISCRTCSSLSTLEAQLHLFWVRVLCDATIYGSQEPFYIILSMKGRVLIIN